MKKVSLHRAASTFRVLEALRWTRAVLPAALLAAGIAMLTGGAAHAQNGDGASEAASEAPAGPATEGVGLVRNEPGAFQGYTLVSPLQSRSTFLIDMEGRVVNSWQSEFTPASLGYLLENGHLLRAGEHPNPPFGSGPAQGGRVQEFDWDGEIVWDFTYSTETALPHHDFTRLPNGNIILVLRELRTKEQAVAAGRIPDSVDDRGMQPDSLIEIRPTGPTTGEIVWEWHLWDHLVQDYDPDRENYGDVTAHPELVDVNFDEGILQEMVDTADGREELRAIGYLGGGGQGGAPINPDWTHTNALDYNEELDQLILSVHEFSEIWVIDHSTTTEEAAGHTGGRYGKGGDILYRWGNPMAYRMGTEEDRQLFLQHDTHWIPEGLPGEGHIMAFNNQNPSEDGNFSTVVEIVPPVDDDGNYTREPDKPFGPEAPAWVYQAPNATDLYSSFISGASRLPNGNTLICVGASGFMIEVTPDKRVVWQYNNPPRNEGGRGGGRRGGGRGRGPGPGGPGRGGPGRGGPPEELEPPRIAELVPAIQRGVMELTDAQGSDLDALQTEIDEGLAEIFNEEQNEQFEALRSGEGFAGVPQPGTILTALQQARLSLSDEQRESVAQLQETSDESLGRILSDEQRERLTQPPAAQARGARRGGGRRGRGFAGRGGGRRGGGRGRGGGGGMRGGSIFRVYRYSPDYPGLVGKELTPDKTLEELAAELNTQGNEQQDED